MHQGRSCHGSMNANKEMSATSDTVMNYSGELENNNLWLLAVYTEEKSMGWLNVTNVK